MTSGTRRHRMKNFAKVNTVLLILVLIMLVAICFLIARSLRSAVNPSAAGGIGWDAKKQLNFAETLATKGLKKEALVAFDDYLKIAKLSAMEAAKLLYRMGNMYMELFDYEKALYYFYKTEAADPNAGFKSELDEKLVECLERLNMTSQARYELAARTSLGPQLPQEPGGVILAKVGDKEITEKEIDDAISEMPDWAKESFSSGEGKAEFVRQYAMTQALYEKAKRMGLEQDAEVQRTIKDITKQLLVKRLLEKELAGKISAQPLDIMEYYQQNQDKYPEKTFEEVKEDVEYEYKNKKVQEQMQILLNDIMQQERVEIYTDKILGEDEEQNKPDLPN